MGCEGKKQVGALSSGPYLRRETAYRQLPPLLLAQRLVEVQQQRAEPQLPPESAGFP